MEPVATRNRGVTLGSVSLSLSLSFLTADLSAQSRSAFQPPVNRAVIAYGTDAIACVLNAPFICPPVCPGDPCPGQVYGNGFLVIYRTSGANDPPTGGSFQTLCPWPGNPSPRPANVVAVDWDPYAQEAYFLTMTANGPGFGEVWRTDLATYTIRTPIVPPAPPGCNSTQEMRFFDLAVYRTATNGGQTRVAIAMNTFFGAGHTGNVDVYDPVSGASVIASPFPGPFCNTNLTYRRIDAGFIQYQQFPIFGFVPGFYVTLLPGFMPVTPNGYYVQLLSIPPTSNNWFPNFVLQWDCSTGAGFETIRPQSVSINSQIPNSCGVPLSEIVVGGVQECLMQTAPAHSYVLQNATSGAQFALRHSTLPSGFNQMATDVVVTAGQPTASAPMYVIQYSPNCNSPAGRFSWFQRECNGGNPVALPNLPLSNVQPVDVTAIR